MFDKKIIDFFKRHNLYDEEMFRCIKNRCEFVDYYNETVNFCIGCPPKVNNKTKRIEGFMLVIPFCVDEKTRLIAVHEIAHAIYWYKKMGKKYNKIEEELFPMILEKLYYEENISPKLSLFEEKLDNMIDSKSEDQYRFAFSYRDHLLNSDLSNFDSFCNTTRKLIKIWKRQNR